MKHKIGDELDLQLLEADRKCIQNLNLFNRVVIMAKPEGENVHLQIMVTEQWYFFPYPILFINERDWSKVSYGVGIIHLNFRGRAETVNLAFWLGHNPSAQVSYTNPWIGGKRHFLAQFNLYYNRVLSKHLEEDEVNENHFGAEGTFGKRFGHHTYVGLSLGYKEITFSPPASGQTLSSSGKDRLPQLGLFWIWDRRDLKEYPHGGWYISFFARQSGFPSFSANDLGSSHKNKSVQWQNSHL
jgi:outer membrane protein assembly factor BamA